MALNNYKILGQESSGIYERLPITDRTLTTNVATVFVTPVSASAHGIAIGDRFDINSTDQSILNFRGVVTASTAAGIQFPRTNANLTSLAQTSAYIYRYSNGLGQSIFNRSKTSGVVTLTTLTPHNDNVGDWITVYMNDTAFDGDFVVTKVPSSTTLEYVSLGANVTSASIANGALAVQKAITVYTVPSGMNAVASTLAISNSLTHSGYFSIYAVKSTDSALSPPERSIISNRTVITAGETYNMTLGHTLGPGEKIVVRASHAGMYFTLFGTELS